MAEPHADVEKCRLELHKIGKQLSRAKKRCRTLAEDEYAARKKLRRAELKCLVGKPVIFAYRRSADEENAWLNDAIGTLVKVARTRGLVDYGEHGQWRIPLDDIRPEGSPQGATMRFMAG